MKKKNKALLLVATIGALAATTGCATVYKDADGNVIYVDDHRARDTAEIMNATGNLFLGLGSAAYGASAVLRTIDTWNCPPPPPPCRYYGW